MATTAPNSRKLNLTRDQLAQFLTDQQQIRQFELLFSVADIAQYTPDEVLEVNIAAGTAQATANDALAQLTRIANAVELLAAAPVIENNNSVVTDYIDFDQSAPHVSRMARMAWNETDQTADIGMEYGVVQQVGLETYARVANFTGVTVENATAVRNQLRAHGAEYHVVKNSILNIAAKQAKLPDISAHLSGHTALVTGGNNPTGVAKILVTFFKDFAKLEVKGGVLDAKILTKAEVEYLSKLPSLDGIRAQLLSLLSTPASQFVRLLDAKREKDEKAA